MAAFDEAACGTETTYVTTATGNDSGNVTGCGEEAGASTSGTPYGGGGCSDGFVVKFTGTISTTAVATAQLNDALTEAQCANASVELAIYNSSGTEVGSAGSSSSSTCGWTSSPSGAGARATASTNWPSGGVRAVAMAGQNLSCGGSPKVCTEGTLNNVGITVAWPPGGCADHDGGSAPNPPG